MEWHRKGVHSTVVKCPCCGKTFKSKTAMIMHQREKEFKKTCQLCNIEFQNPRSYESISKLTKQKTGERLLECVVDFNTNKYFVDALKQYALLLSNIFPHSPNISRVVDFCPPHSPNEGYFFQSELPIFESAYGGVFMFGFTG